MEGKKIVNPNTAHCKGDGCMMNNTCRRYHLHLEYQADKQLQAEISVPYCTEDECLPKGYALYWKFYDLATQEKGGAK